MNLDKIKQKLEALKQQQAQQTGGTKNSDLIWKPQAGKQVIRILPYVHQPDYPFIELNFYYDFGKTWLSPATFNQPDPVVEYCNGLLSNDRKLSKEEFATVMKLKRKLLPKERIYVPILVRGQEEEGVKFYGFAKTIYGELLTIMDDSDYGDITDLQKGRDMNVEFTPAPKEGEYPKTKIWPKGNPSIATDDANVIEKIKSMPVLSDNFTVPTYDELKAALKKYLQADTSQEETLAPAKSLDRIVANQAETEKFDHTNFSPPSGPKEVSEKKFDVSDIEAQFDDLLKK